MVSREDAMSFINEHPMQAIAAVAITITALYYASLLFKRKSHPPSRGPKALPAAWNKDSPWLQLPLVSKTVVSHDTRIFRFRLDWEGQRLGLPVGKHIYARADVKGGMSSSHTHTETHTHT